MPEASGSDKRTAILVIHGIGQQNPFETLNSFAQGLGRYLDDQCATVTYRPERIRHEGWTEVALHLDLDKPVTKKGTQRLSLHEYYWAPHTEGKVTYRGVLAWLIRTALTPLRYLSNNLHMMLETKKDAGFGDIAGLFLREIFRGALLYLPLIIFLVLLYGFLEYTVEDLTTIRSKFLDLIDAEQSPWALGMAGVCLAMAVFLGIFLLKELAHWMGRRVSSTQRKAELWWIGLAALSLIVFLALAYLIVWEWNVNVRAYVELFIRDGVLILLLLVGAAALLRKILIGYVGDVTVYVTADAKAANYQARSAILKESTEALTLLLKNDSYDRVIVAGHSLGSVIAYDTINRLLSTAWATPEGANQKAESELTPDQLNKLKGLVTFGSPLDKIYYFFREEVGADQAVRAQILSFLHSFRKARSGRDYGEFKFTYPKPKPTPLPDRPFDFPQPTEEFCWLNIWSRMDPVSGPLDFYELKDEDQRERWYWVWGVAHLAYWSDPHFYAFFAKRLL